jgi:hypothetical protein
MDSLIEAISTLVGHRENETRLGSLHDALRTRLERSCALTDDELPANLVSLDDLRLLTAARALTLLTHLNSIASRDPLAVALGSHDWPPIRTAFTLIFNWGTNPLLSAAIDKSSPQQLSQLQSLVGEILNLFKVVPRTPILVSFLELHLQDVFRLAFAVGAVSEREIPLPGTRELLMS